MEDDQVQRVRAIQLSMDEASRPAFEDNDIQHMHVLVKLAIQFYDYLRSAPPPDDSCRDRHYVCDSTFINFDSFRVVMNIYGILEGATTTTIDWNVINMRSLKEEFLSMYQAFVTQTNFEIKCRLLLDLFKLQLVYGGAFYDCD
jgi:hypothetical protein